MATYNIRVMVEFDYEVEADTEAEAEQAGWKWEDHTISGEVYSITTIEVLEEEEDEDYDAETHYCGYAIASVGHGNDEDQ